MKNVLKIKNPETGEFEPIAAISGADGAPGANGQGVPTGGTVGQVLKKTGSGDYETGWSDSAGDSERLGNVAAAQYARKNDVPAHNLLDNSDFTNPVNQRGQTSYTGNVYTIDRWRSWDSNNITTLNDGSISVSVHIIQNIPKNCFKDGSTYTFALCTLDGYIYINSGVYTPGGEGFGDWTHTWVEPDTYGNMAVYVRLGTYVWAALYEGSYTADTLPAYVPKGYAAELAACQRYYKKITIGNGFMNIVGFNETEARGLLITSGMRVTPTVNSSLMLRLYNGSSYKTVTSIGVSKMTETSMLLSMVSSDLTKQTLYTIHPSGGYADIELSADL